MKNETPKIACSGINGSDTTRIHLDTGKIEIIPREKIEEEDKNPDGRISWKVDFWQGKQ